MLGMETETNEIALPTLHISRRKMLFMAGCAVIAMTLPGCGGGGAGINPGGGGNISMASYNGQVNLPPGVSASSVLVAGGLMTTAVQQGGGFSLSAPADAPSLITVFNPTTSKAVLMGMTYPGGGGLVIDNNSTATALLWVALGGTSMTRDGIQTMLNAINSSSEVATLAGVIEAAQQTDPYAIANGNAQIVAALQAAANALGPGINSGLSTNKGGGQTAQGNPPTQLLIQPSNQVDGVTFINLDSTTGFNVQNTMRRMGYVYTYLTGHVDASGNKTAVSPPTMVGSPVFVPSCASLLSLSGGWAPASSANVPLTLQGSDAQTDYTMVYLTQVYATSNPGFFSDPTWAGEISKWNTTLSQLGGETFVGYLTNLFISVIGFGGLTWTDVQLGAAMSQMQTIPSVAALIEQAAGDQVLLGELVKLSVQDFVAGDISPLLLQDMSKLVGILSETAAEYLSASAGSVAGLAAITAALSALLAVGAVLLAGDLGAVAHDTSTGDRGDLWTGTVVQQTVTLSPQNPNANPGDTVAFTAKVPTGTPGTITYTWSENATFAVLSTPDGQNGKTITTPDSTANLITTPSDQGNIVVSVTAYSTVNGTKTTVGTATSTVALKSGSNGGGSGSSSITVAGSLHSELNGTYSESCTGYVTSGEIVINPSPQSTYYFGLFAPCSEGVYTMSNSAGEVSYTDGVSEYSQGSVTVTNVGGGEYKFSFQFSGPNGDGTFTTATGTISVVPTFRS